MQLQILAATNVDAGWLLYSLTIAGLGLFFQKCMEPGMIFRRYYLWLTFHWIKSWRKPKGFKRWLLKPFGLCVYCNTTWIAIIYFICWFGLQPEIFLFLGLVYLWLKTLTKIVNT